MTPAEQRYREAGWAFLGACFSGAPAYVRHRLAADLFAARYAMRGECVAPVVESDDVVVAVETALRERMQRDGEWCHDQELPA